MAKQMIDQGLVEVDIGGARVRRVFGSRRQTAGEIAFKAAASVVLFLLALTFLYPFWFTIILSFSGFNDALTLGLHVWPSEWNMEAYEFVFTENVIAVAYFNSIVRTAVGGALTVVVTLMAAYPLSKKNLPGRTGITIYILITMFFSGGLIPTYLLIRSLGLLDKFIVLILPVLAIGFYIIIVRNFLMTVDIAYEESALLDGANYLDVLFRVIMPLAKPVMAVIFLWAAVYHWNEWFHWLIYMKSDSKLVLQMILRRLLIKERELLEQIIEFGDPGDFTNQQRLPPEALKAATTLITIGPIILLYPFLQRYFIKGIFVGSLKG